MKHNHNHANGRNAGLRLMPVLFEFSLPRTVTICVAGAFDRWQSKAKTLHPTGDGHSWMETALAPGTYDYCWQGTVRGNRLRRPEKPCSTLLAE